MLLTHSQEQITRQLIIDLGLGVEASYDENTGRYDGSEWPVFYSKEPNSPDNCITVYDTEARMDARLQIDGSWIERLGLQIRVRGKTKEEARRRANEIAEGLDTGVYDSIVNIESSQYLVHSYSRTSGPLAIGAETPTSKRQVVTINHLVCLNQL